MYHRLNKVMSEKSALDVAPMFSELEETRVFLRDMSFSSFCPKLRCIFLFHKKLNSSKKMS